MTSTQKKLSGVAMIAVGLLLTANCQEKNKPSKQEIVDTRGGASVSVSLPGLALIGLGAYLILKKDN